MSLALVIHGGAWNVPDAEVDEHRAGIGRALESGWRMLQEGAGAVDAVEHAVTLLEEDPTFNAGRGSHLNRSGKVELDASVMEGTGLEAGAVASVERIAHPVRLARRIMERSEHVLLVGDGARRFAVEEGFELCRSRDLLIGRERERYLRIRRGETSLVEEEFAGSDDAHMGTVGAVAVDREGRTAAATSTGGTQDKYPGRVGDSPLIGAGTYADDRAGACSCTGWGEGILRVVMAKHAIDRLALGDEPEVAAGAAIAQLERVDGRGGMILVDPGGGVGIVYNTPAMARGVATEDGDLRVGVYSELDPWDGEAVCG